IPVVVAASDENLRRVFAKAREQIARLVRASEVTVNERLDAPKASARAVLSGGAELAVPLEGLIDFEQERRRLQREQEKLQAEATKLEAQLGNPNFVERAPVERVNEVRERIAAIAQQSSQLQQTVEHLQCTGLTKARCTRRSVSFYAKTSDVATSPRSRSSLATHALALASWPVK